MKGRLIAVVNFTRMGDLIQSGPFMRSLKGPDDRLTLIVYESFREVAERLPMVDTVVTLDLDGLLTQLDSEHANLPHALRMLQEFATNALSGVFDELWNLAHTPLSATLCGLITAERKHGLLRQPDGQLVVHGDWFYYLLSVMDDRADNPFNLAEIYLRLGGRPNERFPLEFVVSPSDREQATNLLAQHGVEIGSPYVVFQPGASSPSRQWPTSAFAELARLFATCGCKTVITGSAGERSLAQDIVLQSRSEAISLTGKTDVGTLAAILQGAKKLISNDTGTIHLGAAVGTPCIGTYIGPAAAKDTAPYGEGHIVIEPDLRCAPCGYHDLCTQPSCRSAIRAEAVFSLAMARREDIEMVARSMRGTRLHQTHLSSTGGFALHSLNPPRDRRLSERLHFYRRFWDGLLGSSRDHERTLAGERLEDSAEWTNAVIELQTILHEAMQASTDGRSLSRLVARQLEWQRRLHAFATTGTWLAPVARFALTRARYARLRTASELQEDLRAVVDVLERGIRLAQSACPQHEEQVAAHV